MHPAGPIVQGILAAKVGESPASRHRSRLELATGKKSTTQSFAVNQRVRFTFKPENR
jgi:hypothetical protein